VVSQIPVFGPDPSVRSAVAGYPSVLRYPWLRLLLLAFATVLVQGYHSGVDDAEIYLPAIKYVFDPHLYPFGREFFLSHAHLSLFAATVGTSARLLHLPVETAVFFWHLGCLFLLLLAGWQLASVLFRSASAHWGAVTVLASVLSVPVAGTALVLSDNYFSARSFSTPFALLSIGFLLRGRLSLALLWLLLTALFHPQMAVYCASSLAFFWWVGRPSRPALELSGDTHPLPLQTLPLLALPLLALVPARLPGGFSLAPASGAYREVLYSRSFFFASLWHWYEWIGVFAPLLLLATFAWRPSPGISAAVAKVSRALVLLGASATALFLLLSSSARLNSFARLQPMRVFHILHFLMFLILGGLLGEHALRYRAWRWVVLFVPLAIGMFALDRSIYPASAHIEWPWQTPCNPWLAAFAWTRANTPVDSVFALDPTYLLLRGEDRHGFRALAERSALADFYKDSGAVAMFPGLLPDWERQQQVQQGWSAFGPTDFRHLSRISPVTWVIVRHSQKIGLSCPYNNPEISVCSIGATN